MFLDPRSCLLASVHVEGPRVTTMYSVPDYIRSEYYWPDNKSLERAYLPQRPSRVFLPGAISAPTSASCACGGGRGESELDGGGLSSRFCFKSARRGQY